jgi:hypothetical protein
MLPMLLGALSLCTVSLAAGPVSLSKRDGPYKLVLELLPAEPFLNHTEMQAGKPGMIWIAGAPPDRLDAPNDPNHHLIVHVLNAQTGKAIAGAQVRMSYERLGVPGATVHRLPVVEMQKNGHGAASTHYGNNVHLAAGRYRVSVQVNGGRKVTFIVRTS